jgi:hypothetical protein
MESKYPVVMIPATRPGNELTVTENSEFDCYAQRLLNPFRGCVNIIRYHSAEAVSADGVHWDIYVSNAGLAEGLPEPRRTQVSDIRFGTWSRRDGLRRGPIFPSDDFRRMEATGQRTYEHLLEVHEQLPFPFLDGVELWLLDTQRRPLVLLDSALTVEDISRRQGLRWTPGLDSRQSFTSTAAPGLDLDPRQPGAVADYLAYHINRLAGEHPCAQVFRRHRDGHATGLDGIHLDPAVIGRELDADAFPQHFIDLAQQDAAHRQLVEDFIRWQAPWQLLRQDLDHATRSEFEQHARVQPLKIAQQYHLYPEIVNQAIIDAARVEARLRQTAPARPEQDKVMSTFYIELGPEVAS